VDRAAVLLDDAVRNGEPQPRALADWFRGKKRLKKVRQILGRNATPVVLDLDDDRPLPLPLPYQGRGACIPAAAPRIRGSPSLVGKGDVEDLKQALLKSENALLPGQRIDPQTVKNALMQQGAQVKVVSRLLGTIKGTSGQEVPVDKSAITTDAIMFDAVFVPSGAASVAQLLRQGAARQFVAEAFKHGKAIGAMGEGIQLLYSSNIPGLVMEGKAAGGTASSTTTATVVSSNGVVTAPVGSNPNTFVEQFVTAIAQHRHWGRPQDQVTA